MSPHSILVVDDSPEALELYRELFELDGYRVQLASSVDSARRAVRAHVPSVVVIDDDPGGIRAGRVIQTVTDEIERYASDRPLYVAIRGDMVINELHDLPQFDHVLVKPVNFAELDCIIREALIIGPPVE